jgi:hypothetical protein
VRRGNRLAAGKGPFRIKFGMMGDFPSNNGFEGFVCFVMKLIDVSW